MLYQQKETILANLKFKDENRTCGNRKYWFSYKDFLDPTDPFTDFSCENQEGKRKYIALIENLLERDETAKVFVEVYGLEEDDSGQFIYAEYFDFVQQIITSCYHTNFYGTRRRFSLGYSRSGRFHTTELHNRWKWRPHPGRKSFHEWLFGLQLLVGLGPTVPKPGI